MPLISRKNPSYLVKHRRKWQVKITIPTDVRWAFQNKTTYKRSTGCNIVDVKHAKIQRDAIVAKFRAIVKLHRSVMPHTEKHENILNSEFNNRPFPPDYQRPDTNGKLTQNINVSVVEGWIKERLLNKSKNAQVLPHDFWNIKRK